MIGLRLSRSGLPRALPPGCSRTDPSNLPPRLSLRARRTFLRHHVQAVRINRSTSPPQNGLSFEAPFLTSLVPFLTSLAPFFVVLAVLLAAVFPTSTALFAVFSVSLTTLSTVLEPVPVLEVPLLVLAPVVEPELGPVVELELEFVP